MIPGSILVLLLVLLAVLWRVERRTMSQTIVLFGPPGCGKGTQAARMKDSLGVPHISTGDMFRDHKARDTDLGKQVAAILASGDLVPDSVTNDMVRERLGRDDVAMGALLDGYPRNVDQAKELESILQANDRKISSVVVIAVEDEELVKRILKRGEASRRADDTNEATIRNRLSVYKEQSEPCVAYFEGAGTTIHRINGVGTIDEITARILGALGAA